MTMRELEQAWKTSGRTSRVGGSCGLNASYVPGNWPAISVENITNNISNSIISSAL
jgi:hypothetical protein